MENNNRQGCRWTKASERLPEKEGQYYVLMDNWNGTVYFNGNRFETGDWIKIERIQWLDESPIEPCATSQLAYLIKIFELRIKTHKKNGMRYFNNHQNNESLVYLGKQKEAQFILSKLKLLEKC